METYKNQDNELIYALDIGTRGVVGVVGRAEGGKFHVLDMEQAEHEKRTMVDGQIDNIRQVGALARTVTERLEERLQVHLERVSVAAAGRALRTEKGSFRLERTNNGEIGAEEISQLETGAVSMAEEKLQSEEDSPRQLFLVGYTVSQYRLDRYPLNSLLDHTGRVIEADVVATFLPSGVVESLYAAMDQAGLKVASLTLEPIAAMNAAIPQELRLLNLVLVDIGAGTTDIAICKDGSVVGYTMTTIAGDEITEEIMRAYLVDFQMAEKMKRSIGQEEDILYKDVLGFENSCTSEELSAAVKTPMEHLAKSVSEQVLALNTAPPSAVFLAGGGSRLNGLRECVAQELGMDLKRVSTAGSNYEKTMFAQDMDLNNPEYATPLGIALSAGLGLLNDSYMVMLNNKSAKLFRSGALTLRDILLMNGYTYSDMLARSGKSLSVTVNGQRITMRGEPGSPATLKLNGEEAPLTRVVAAGDRIDFEPAVAGRDACVTVQDVLEDSNCLVLVNGEEVSVDTELRSGDEVVTMERPKAPAPKQPVEEKEEKLPSEQLRPLDVILNGNVVHFPGKENGQPYYLMDLLDQADIDFDRVDRPVHLKVNGEESEFRHELRTGDTVEIYCEE